MDEPAHKYLRFEAVIEMEEITGLVHELRELLGLVRFWVESSVSPTPLCVSDYIEVHLVAAFELHDEHVDYLQRTLENLTSVCEVQVFSSLFDAHKQ